MKKLKKEMIKFVVTRFVIPIVGAFVIALTILHIIRYKTYSKIYGTWRGNRVEDGEQHNFTFTLSKNGTYEFKDFKDGSLYRMIHGHYSFRDNWLVMRNKNHPLEKLEFLYKEGKLYCDGTVFTQ